MISFSCSGHPNITSSHQNTFEITKEPDVTPTGHCIIGIKADYDLFKVRKLNRGGKRLRMTLDAAGVQEEVSFIAHPGFLNKDEMVVRKTGFTCKRTLGIRADKASNDFSPGFKKALKDPNSIIKVTIEPWEEDN